MQATKYAEGLMIDHTPATAVTGGDVVEVGSIPMVALKDIAANELGALAVEGVYDVVKAEEAFTAGDAVYWDNNGSPYGGVALSGAATGTAGGNNLMGWAIEDAASAYATVRVKLTASKRTTTIAGSVTADDITGSDATLTVTGKAGAAGSAGGTVPITAGAGHTNGAGGAAGITGGAGAGTGAGGAVNLTGGASGAGATGNGGAFAVVGGAASSTNGAGGAGTVTGGAGAGTGAGGAIGVAGGASGAGATGNGGAGSLVGGAALSTNGNGGAAAVTGGVATGTGTGGAVAITSGASAGATGTAGAVAIDCGAATGGTAGAITIGGTNAGSITMGKMPVVPSATVAADGSAQGDAAAIATGITWVTAADGTKGVKLPAAAAGLLCIVKNDDAANAILKVYPNSSDTINALGANNSISMAAKTACVFACYDATAWFTVPLLPS